MLFLLSVPVMCTSAEMVIRVIPKLSLINRVSTQEGMGHGGTNLEQITR